VTIFNIIINVKRITQLRAFCLAFEEERPFDKESVRSASLKMLYAWRMLKTHTE